MQREPVTAAQVTALRQAIGGNIAAMICGLNEVDLSMGRGILEGSSRCLWTTKGHRITIDLVTGGGCIASKSRTPDPDRPTTSLESAQCPA